MKYSIHVSVHRLTRRQCARVTKLTTFPGIVWGYIYSKHKYGSLAWGEVKEMRGSLDGDLRPLAKKFIDQVREIVGGETGIVINFIPEPRPTAVIEVRPGDACKGCGISASRLGADLDADGYHIGCEYKNATPEDN